MHTPNLRAVLTHLGGCGLDVLQVYEEALLVLALRASPREIHTFCRELALVHRPDRERDQVRAQGGRLVRIHRLGDLAHVDAMLDPVLADELTSTLAVMVRHSRVADDPRNHAERSADALEELLRRGMNNPDTTTDVGTDAGTDAAAGDRGRARPHASVSVQLETLLGMGAAGSALLAHFGVIPTSTAARVACDAVVRLVVKHGDTVLNVGQARRVVSGRQRAALAQTYRTCVVPGCAVRFADCDIHHVWWWSLAGPTDLDLQLPLCSAHHRWLHEGGYSITREDHVLVFRDPNGRVIANVDHTLTRQLDLLRQAHPRDQRSHPRGAADDIAQHLATWTNSRYRHGRWGWTGHDPGPPPGHAPPQPA